jgi:hypothetical protein
MVNGCQNQTIADDFIWCLVELGEFNLARYLKLILAPRQQHEIIPGVEIKLTTLVKIKIIPSAFAK